MSKDTRVHRGSDGNLYLVREHKTRPKPEPKPKPPKEGEQSAEDKKAKRRKRRRRLRKSFGSSSRSESEGFVSPSRTSGTQQTTGKKDNNGYDSPSRHDSDSPLNSDFNSSDSIGSRSNYYTSDSRRLDPDFKAPSRITRVVNFLLGTSSVEPKMADQEKMAHSSERFEKASTTSSEKITELPLPPGTNPPPGVNLPPGFYPQAGIYQQGGRTMALLPKSQIMEMGGFPQQGFGPQYMYPPQMGPHMMMGGFGGFNSRYEPARPTEVTTVVPGTNVTVARHICANCGTLRSRKFQAENPIEPGEVAPISYCRKCEKEIKSTDSEDSEYDIDFGKGKKPKVKKVDTSSKRVEKKAPKNKLHKKASKSSIKVEKTVLVVDKADTAFLHTCAQCGKARSRKYQARHPIKKGQPPTPAFCGKCQKEETSSEDSAASDSEDESDDSIQSRRRGGDRYIKTKEKVSLGRPNHCSLANVF